MRRGRLTVRPKNLPLHPDQQQDEQLLKKQVDQLNQLLDQQDFTVDQLFETIDKSKHGRQLLTKLNQPKLRHFLSKNYKFFLETQQQLGQIKLPALTEVKPTVYNQIIDLSKNERKEEVKESSVFQILDSFNNSLFEGDYEECLRILKILREMSTTDKYEKFFHKLDIAKIARESYASWIDACKSEDVLLKAGTPAEVIPSVKVFFNSRSEQIIGQLSASIAIIQLDSNSISREVSKLLKHIQKTMIDFREKYKKFETTVPAMYSYSSKWTEDIVLEFYELVQGAIYETDELEDTLLILGKILSASAELESKGISLVRSFKKLISRDLSVHFERFIEIIMESFDDVLKEDQALYEMVEFKSIKSVSDQLNNLKEVDSKNYKVVCSSKKAILLINAYGLLLQPIFEKKWEFLHAKILNILCQKSSDILKGGQLGLWDCYNLFKFFDDLHKGKIRNRPYNNFTQQYKAMLKNQFGNIQSFSKICWERFQSMITDTYFRGILTFVPKMIWENGKVYASKQKIPPHPETFALGSIQLWREFMKQLESRLSQPQFEYIGLSFYEYFVYVVEYVVYISYHSSSDKPENFFLLPKKHQKLWQIAKKFPMKQIPDIQQNKVYKLSYFTVYGMECFIFDMHLIADVLGKLLKSDKVSAELFAGRVVKVQQKEKKSEPVEFRKQYYMPTIMKYQSDLDKNLEAVKRSASLKRTSTNTHYIK